MWPTAGSSENQNNGDGPNLRPFLSQFEPWAVLALETMVSKSQDASGAFEALRGRLFGLAYRMLGSRADAEDIVQEAYLRGTRPIGPHRESRGLAGDGRHAPFD